MEKAHSYRREDVPCASRNLLVISTLGQPPILRILIGWLLDSGSRPSCHSDNVCRRLISHLLWALHELPMRRYLCTKIKRWPYKYA